MSGNQMLLLAGAQRAAVDPYFYSVTSLLHGDGTNGGQNNTFLDSSSNNFTITRNGNTTQGSFSPFSQTGWSGYVSPNNYLTIPDNAAFQFGSGDYTIECWINLSAITAGGGIFGYGPVGGLTNSWSLEYNSGTSALSFWNVNANNATYIINGTTNPVNNQWTHVAISRSGNNTRFFVNGTQQGATYTSTYTNGTGNSLYIGAGFYAPSTRTVTGYISNLRIVKGTGLYTANFTPSIKPLTAVSGTSLLTLQSNRFVDNSSSALTISTGGSPSVQPFSPFNPTSAYSTSAVGGSGYFDGSGDYLTAPDDAFWDLSAGTGSIELFVYPSAAPTNTPGLVGQCPTTANWGSYVYSDGRVAVGIQGTSELSAAAGSLIVAAWNHIVITRDNSTGRTRLFVNGVLKATGTGTYFNNSSAALHIGYFNNYAFNGYIADVRFCKGSIPTTYQTSSTTIDAAIFTPPSSPVTTSSQGATAADTELLLSYTNGAIFDNAAVADYETVGNAQISTSVKKYGTGSIYLDGTGDYLDSPPSRNFDFDAGDFTIEAWIYTTSLATEQGICANQDNGTNTTLDGWVFNVGTTGALAFLDYTNASAAFSVVSSASAIAINTWYHVAVCRVAGTVKLYINGTAVATGTRTASIPVSTSNQPFRVGNWRYATDTNREFTGYIDDLRISKGIGRYPYNFTPPTAEFPNIGGTPPALTFDPYYDYTTLLLPGNGTNGAQNNTFLDGSTNNFTITRNGNTTQGTFSPFSQTGWGNYFDGTGDALTVADNAALDMGSSDFTIECWAYLTTTGSDCGIVSKWNQWGTAGTNSYLLYYSSAGNLEFLVSTGGTIGDIVLSSAATLRNTWVHIAAVRSGSNFALFANGTRLATASSASSVYDSTQLLRIGEIRSSVANFPGYLSNVRIVKGTAVYDPTQASITVPTAPLTAITNTSLLTCQSNRFIDNSTNAFAITRNGDVSVQSFSPFNPTAAWSAATNGGSGYFDGSGDYLSVADNTALDISGQFTWECWVYFSSISGSSDNILYSKLIVTPSVTGLEIGVNTTGKFYVWINGSVVITSTSSVSAGQWVHLAASRDGSNNVRIFINGISAATAVSNSADTSTSASVILGANYAGSARVTGYISNFRLVKGTAVYTANFTPPTSPLTAITNTSLLCNFTNAGIYDATSKNDLETVGNAQISTTQSKFGGSSMYFDGTGDYLFRNGASDLFVINSDYTVECWVYFNSTSGTQILVSYGTLPWYLCIGDITAGKAQFTWASSAPTNYHATGTTTLSTGTWYHIAGVRYGSNIYLYVNGTQEAVTAISGSPRSPSTNALAIGANAAGSNTANAYIQDLRITKGIARYTSNFTPPSTAFLTL